MGKEPLDRINRDLVITTHRPELDLRTRPGSPSW